MTKIEKSQIFEQYEAAAHQFCQHKKNSKTRLAKQADRTARELAALLPSTERVKLDKIRREVFRKFQMAEFFGVSECV